MRLSPEFATRYSQRFPNFFVHTLACRNACRFLSIITFVACIGCKLLFIFALLKSSPDRRVRRSISFKQRREGEAHFTSCEYTIPRHRSQLASLLRLFTKRFEYGGAG